MAIAVAIAKTAEYREIADRRKNVEPRGFYAWAENNRKQRRASDRSKKQKLLKGVRP